AGFPLYDDRQDGRKIWKLIEGYKQRLTQTFTLAELSALYFSKNLLPSLGGAPSARAVESAFAKIQEALPEKSLPYLGRIQELFSARPDPWKDYSTNPDGSSALNTASPPRKTKPYRVDPYRLVYWHGGLYLYARAEQYDEVRTFAVERIEKIEVL